MGRGALLSHMDGKKHKEMKAEIYWMFHIVNNSLSVNSNDGMDKLFKKIRD